MLLKGLRRERSEAGEVERSGSWVRRDQPIWLRDERKADSEEADMVARESGEVKMGDVVWSDSINGDPERNLKPHHDLN